MHVCYTYIYIYNALLNNYIWMYHKHNCIYACMIFRKLTDHMKWYSGCWMVHYSNIKAWKEICSVFITLLYTQPENPPWKRLSGRMRRSWLTMHTKGWCLGLSAILTQAANSACGILGSQNQVIWFLYGFLLSLWEKYVQFSNCLDSIHKLRKIESDNWSITKLERYRMLFDYVSDSFSLFPFSFNRHLRHIKILFLFLFTSVQSFSLVNTGLILVSGMTFPFLPYA